MRTTSKAIAVLIFCAAPLSVWAAGPDLSACPALEPAEAFSEEMENPRTNAPAVPEKLRQFVSASRDQLAVATLAGSVTCLDIRTMSTIGEMKLTRSDRFLGFDWWSYESFGHVLIDRLGSGTAIDTGVEPFASPSGQRFGALQVSTAAFGSLEGLGVWVIADTGLEEEALIHDLPEMAEWRFDGWATESCIELSAIPFERLPAAGGSNLGDVPRDRYVVRSDGTTWRVEPNERGCRAD